MQKILIDQKTPLDVGDVIEIHYKLSGPVWLRATVIDAIERKLRGSDIGFELISTEDDTDSNRLIIKARRIEKPDPAEPERYEAGITVAASTIIALIATAGIGLFVWLSLDRIYKIVDNPAGQTALAGGGLVALVAGITGLLALIKGGKK